MRKVLVILKTWKETKSFLFTNYTIADQNFYPEERIIFKDWVNISNKTSDLAELIFLIFVPLLKYSRGWIINSKKKGY